MNKTIVKTSVEQIPALQVNQAALSIIAEKFKQVGITEEDPYIRLKAGLTATKTIVSKFGTETTEDDYATQHKYVCTVLEMMGHLKAKITDEVPKSIELKINSKDVERMEEIAKELVELEVRMRGSKIQQGEVIDV